MILRNRISLTQSTISPILPEVWTRVQEDNLNQKLLGFADPTFANHAINWYGNVLKPRDYAIVSVVELAPGIVACLDTDREYFAIYSARRYKLAEGWSENGESMEGAEMGVLNGIGFIPQVSSFSSMQHKAKQFISHRISDDPILWHEPIRSEVSL